MSNAAKVFKLMEEAAPYAERFMLMVQKQDVKLQIWMTAFTMCLLNVELNGELVSPDVICDMVKTIAAIRNVGASDDKYGPVA